MTGISRGEDYTWFITNSDGELVKAVQPNDMNFQPVENTERQERCGTRESPPRQTYQGWQGDATFEQESFALDDLMDSQMDAYFKGEPVPGLTIIHTKYVPAIGATRTYRYTQVTISVQDNASGQKDAVTRQVNWQAGRRQELAS